MRRIAVFLGFTSWGTSEQRAVPETMIDEEIVRLTSCVPKTAAEKAFHTWLIKWKDKRNGS